MEATYQTRWLREHPGDLRIQRNGLHALYDLTYDANYENVPWAHERGIMAVRAGANEAYKNAGHWWAEVA